MSTHHFIGGYKKRGNAYSYCCVLQSFPLLYTGEKGQPEASTMCTSAFQGVRLYTEIRVCKRFGKKQKVYTVS